MSLQALLVVGPYRATTKPHLEGGVVIMPRKHGKIEVKERGWQT